MGRRAGRSDAVLSGVWERMRALCEPRPEEAPLRVGDAVSAAARLGAKRLCLAEPAVARLRMRCAVIYAACVSLIEKAYHCQE